MHIPGGGRRPARRKGDGRGRARRAAVLAALLVASLLTGCLGRGGRGGGDDATDDHTHGDGHHDGDGPDISGFFDGERAHGYVAQLVERSRVPGTGGHSETKDLLWATMDVEGWTRERQDFTGSEYLELDHGEVSGFTSSCSVPERERVEDLEFTNFVATFDTPSDRTWWLGAHWDAKRHATEDEDPEKWDDEVAGANDGASGVGLLLQLMREVAAGDPKVEPIADLGIVLFDGEDGFEDCHPLAGSIWFVDHMDERRFTAADRFLLLDMVGDPDARFVREVHSRGCADAWVDHIWSQAPEHGLGPNFVNVSRHVADDHVPFAEAGIPAVDIIDFGRDTRYGFPPYWHTTEDTLDKVDAGMLLRMGELVLDLLDDDVDVGCVAD